MKKLLLFTVVTLCGIAFGQIAEKPEIKKELIGKVYQDSKRYARLERWNENTIVCFYTNTKYAYITDVDSFTFNDEDGSLNQLYEILLAGIKAGEKTEKTLELPDVNLYLKFDKALGKGFVEISVQDKNVPSIIGYMVWLNEKKLNKLFGKNK